MQVEIITLLRPLAKGYVQLGKDKNILLLNLIHNKYFEFELNDQM